MSVHYFYGQWGAKISRPILIWGEGEEEGAIYFEHTISAIFFLESYIMRIITVIRAQQKHKGMF